MFQGGCRCGQARYRVALDRLPASYACHCLDCQTWTGSAFSQQVIIPDRAFCAAGSIGLFELTGSSGRVSTQRACPVCFTRLFNTNTGRPGMVVLRAGSLDNSADVRCVAHLWASRKQAWIAIPDGVTAWSENADPAALASILEGDA